MKITPLIILVSIAQFTLTFVVLFCIYMFFALYDSDFGLDGLVGLVIIQPVFAVIFSLFTIFFCGIIGLPIRLSRKINHWWVSKFYISIIGFLCGFTLLTLSTIPIFIETIVVMNDPDQVAETVKQIPNTTFAISGWLLVAFSLLHFYPPFFNKYSHRIHAGAIGGGGT